MKIIKHTKGTIKSIAAERPSTARPISSTDVPAGSQGIDSCQPSACACSPPTIVATTIPHAITVDRVMPPMAILELRRLLRWVKRMMATNANSGKSGTRGVKLNKNPIRYIVLRAARQYIELRPSDPLC